MQSTLTLHHNTITQFETLKAIMIALKIKFEVIEKEEIPYNEVFVKTVIEAEKQIKNGHCKNVSSEGFDALWK